VLNYPDLTLEGSAILGGALCYLALKAGCGPFTSLLIGAAGGAAAGLMTAAQYLYLGISKLLSGIISTAILYSLNIRLLGGRANVRFDNLPVVFEVLNPRHSRGGDIIVLAGIVLCVLALCVLLFRTRLGLLLRALGDNPSFVTSLSQNPNAITLWGLAISNAIIGLGGAILVQYKSTCDVNMSFGLLIAALAAMVLGETVLAPRTIFGHLAGSVAGTVTYNFAIALVLFSWNSDWDKLVMASDVRLVTGLLLLAPAVLKMMRRRKFTLFRTDW
jgi:putative ABC transport system permease protein